MVCSVSYEPIAGHRPYPLIKYLSEGREIEMALAPVAGHAAAGAVQNVG